MMVLSAWTVRFIDLPVWILMSSVVTNEAAAALGASSARNNSSDYQRPTDVRLVGTRQQCSDALQVAMSRMSDLYQSCLPVNVVDIMRVCENCGEPYRVALEAFADLEKTLHCLADDTVIHAAFGTFIGFWDETGCNNCYVEPVTVENHNSPPRLRMDVQHFRGNLSAVDMCIAAHPDNTACSQCRQPYETVVEMYKKLLSLSVEKAKEEEDADGLTALRLTFDKYYSLLGASSTADDESTWRKPRALASGSRLCVDVVQAMNKTRSTWEARGCEQKRPMSSLVGPIVVVATMLVLPILFYILVFYISIKRHPYVEVRQKRLRWRYNTMSEDYLDDKSQEISQRT